MSRVLNGHRHVGAGPRARVLTAVAELAYRPDVAARSMRTGSSRAVGYVVSDFANPLFASIAVGADAALQPHGYSLVLANSVHDAAREADLLDALRDRRVEGLLVSVVDERAPGLAERLGEYPAVCLLDREVEGVRADAVLFDHAHGITGAVEHLRQLGHERIALVAGSENQHGSRARVAAFRAAAGRHLDERLVRTGELSAQTGYLATQDLLALEVPPTALLAGNNQLLEGVLAAIVDRGLQIPQDLSLVTCDDVGLARLHHPPIDVVERDPLALGRAAAELLLGRVADPAAPARRILLPTAFCARASSATARKRVS